MSVRFHTTAVAALLAVLTGVGSVGASPQRAAADDYYFDVIHVTSVQLDPPVARLDGLRSTPVTITVRTKGYKTEAQYLTLVEQQRRYTVSGDLLVPLRRVGDADGLTTWRGILRPHGPSRTVRFEGAWPCALPAGAFQCGTWSYPDFLSTWPAVPVTASHVPHVSVRTAPAVVSLDRSSYVVSGQVLDSATGRPFGVPVRLSVQRDAQCDTPHRGVGVITGRDGRFRVTLSNRHLPDSGAEALGQHCVIVWQRPLARDSAGRPVRAARREFRPAWSSVLPVTHAKTVRSGASFVVQSLTRLPQSSRIDVQRLHGRTAWRTLAQVYVNGRGGASARIPAGALGRGVYRLVGTTRWGSTSARSQPFTVTTVR